MRTTYSLGVILPGAGESKATYDADRHRLDRRAFERLSKARSIVEFADMPGTIDVLRANAAVVDALSRGIGAHIDEHGVNQAHWLRVTFDLQLVLTNWLAAWRIYRDHCTAHFNKGSRERAKVAAAQSREFDGDVAYRFAEGLRDFVTHVGLPPIEMSVTAELDRKTNTEIRHWECAFRAVALLGAWSEWKAPLRRDLVGGLTFSLGELVTRCMAAAERIELVMSELDRPRQRRAARMIVRACDRLEGDGIPCLYRLGFRETTSFPAEMTPMPLPLAKARAMLDQ